MVDGVGVEAAGQRTVLFVAPLGTVLKVTQDEADLLDDVLYADPNAAEVERQRRAEVFDPESPVFDPQSLGMVNCARCWRPLFGERTQEKRARGLIMFETSAAAVAGRVMDANREVALPYCRACLRKVHVSWRPPVGSVSRPDSA